VLGVFSINNGPEPIDIQLQASPVFRLELLQLLEEAAFPLPVWAGSLSLLVGS
jgi:hypothetical protein